MLPDGTEAVMRVVEKASSQCGRGVEEPGLTYAEEIVEITPVENAE